MGCSPVRVCRGLKAEAVKVGRAQRCEGFFQCRELVLVPPPSPPGAGAFGALGRLAAG